MSRLFGTDGIRGIANKELSPSLAFNVGRALSQILSKTKKNFTVLIATDTRISANMIESSLASGIMSEGGDVCLLGVLPTPAAAYLVKKYKADSAVVISASHNPYEYNGIKIFKSDGYKLSDSDEDRIEKIIKSSSKPTNHLSNKIGILSQKHDVAKEDYIKFLISSERTLKSMKSKPKILVDTANGAAYEIIKPVLRGLGFTVDTVFDSPNGTNINEKCGAIHPEILAKKVRAGSYDLGFCLDGDADRLITIDDKGKVVDGDALIYVFAKMLKAQKKLRNNKIAFTLMSNLGLRLKLDDAGIKYAITNVGDRYVLEKMLKEKLIFGGEQSGHLIFLDNNTTGDGVYALLKVLRAICTFKKSLSQLVSEIQILPQVIINAKAGDERKKSIKKDKNLLKIIKEVESELTGQGRVVVRPSGTEKVVRVMIEGENKKNIEMYAKKIVKAIEKEKR